MIENGLPIQVIWLQMKDHSSFDDQMQSMVKLLTIPL